MTVEQYLRQMLGDLMLSNAKLAAERDALAEKLKAALPPVPQTPDNEGGVSP